MLAIYDDPMATSCMAAYVIWYKEKKRFDKTNEVLDLLGTFGQRVLENRTRKQLEAWAEYSSYRSKLEQKYGYLSVADALDKTMIACQEEVVLDEIESDIQYEVGNRLGCYRCIFNGHKEKQEGTMPLGQWCRIYTTMPPMLLPECSKFEAEKEL